jgi:predicted transcriptional regulator of viral defense system
MFIDDFMRHLGRPYYVGLLSAAALHGAAHQQPQSFFTIIAKPPVRPVQANGMNLQFSVKSAMPLTGIDKKKSAAGYFRVSSPALTAIDLLGYLRQVGGIAAAFPVLEELVELLDEESLGQVAKEASQTASLQRLGYMLGEVLGEKGLSDVAMAELRSREYFHISLDPSVESQGCHISQRWKVRVNADLETGL